MQIYFNLLRPNSIYQSHKHESKMLIEHNNRSIEDKPIIQIRFYNSSCPAKIESSVRYGSQQGASANKVFLNIRSANPPKCHTQPSKKAHQKSMLVNQVNAADLGLRSTCSFFLDFCAQLYGLQKSDFQESLEVKQSMVDHG